MFMDDRSAKNPVISSAYWHNLTSSPPGKENPLIRESFRIAFANGSTHKTYNKGLREHPCLTPLSLEKEYDGVIYFPIHTQHSL